MDETCLQTRQAKRRSPQTPLVGGRRGNDLHPVPVVDLRVRVLDEHPAHHAPEIPLAGRRSAALAVLEDPRARLGHEDLERGALVARSDQHLDELLREARGERVSDRPVERYDAAVGGDGVRGERFLVRLLDRGSHARAARVRVLDDHAGRHRELPQEAAGGVEVVQVVERQLPAGPLVDAREQVPPCARLRVVGGPLVGVLAVREVERLLERDDQPGRERLAVREPAGDRRLVSGGVCEGVGGQHPPLGERQIAGAQLRAAARRTGPARRRG